MSKSQHDREAKVTVRANDFRYIPCDYASIALREDGIKLILGVEEVNGSATELVAAQMTLETAHGLIEVLIDAMGHAAKEFDVKFEGSTSEEKHI